MYTPPKSSGLSLKEEMAKNKRIALAQADELGPVSAWSPTLVDKFESCRYQVFLGKVKKIKQDSGEAANRGIKVHDMAEAYVNGSVGDMPEELKKFRTRFENLREDYAAGIVTLEQDWGYTIDWEPCGFFDKNVWLRIKLDACWFSDIPENAEYAVVIDYKTGKKFGNELKHGFQGLVYAIGTFMRYPKLNRIETEFWYLDKGEELKKVYNRAELQVFLPRITARGKKITSCKDFYPDPSPRNCRFCYYRESGDCEWAVHEEAPSSRHESLKQRGRIL